MRLVVCLCVFGCVVVFLFVYAPHCCVVSLCIWFVVCVLSVYAVAWLCVGSFGCLRVRVFGCAVGCLFVCLHVCVWLRACGCVCGCVCLFVW